jgi:hypothetical protein
VLKEVKVRPFNRLVSTYSVPFLIDFDTLTVDLNVVMAALPKRLQKILGVTVPVVAGTPDLPHIEEGGKLEPPAEVEQDVEVA